MRSRVYRREAPSGELRHGPRGIRKGVSKTFHDTKIPQITSYSQTILSWLRDKRGESQRSGTMTNTSPSSRKTDIGRTRPSEPMDVHVWIMIHRSQFRESTGTWSLFTIGKAVWLFLLRPGRFLRKGDFRFFILFYFIFYLSYLIWFYFFPRIFDIIFWLERAILHMHRFFILSLSYLL